MRRLVGAAAALFLVGSTLIATTGGVVAGETRTLDIHSPGAASSVLTFTQYKGRKRKSGAAHIVQTLSVILCRRGHEGASGGPLPRTSLCSGIFRVRLPDPEP